jgi:ABC-type branched-subunit amino acid transport system ATPase component
MGRTGGTVEFAGQLNIGRRPHLIARIGIAYVPEGAARCDN